jgi:phosphatidylinositol alpha-1,6-mannosyltransferase
VATYPGDLELSRGSRIVAAAAPKLLESCPDLVLVFACRKKTQRADDVERELRHSLASFGNRVRFVGEVADLTDLLALSTVVLFPVDDLYGKVDLPIALLEAMALGIPIVALDKGPLSELGAGLFAPTEDPDAFAKLCLSALLEPDRRAELAARGRETIARRHRPETVAAAYEELYRRLVSRR